MTDWAPLIGSTFIAFAALITLFFTVRQGNKTLQATSAQHSQALEATERRDWVQWKRTKIAEYCEDILSNGYRAASLLSSVPLWAAETQPFYQAYYEVNDYVLEIPKSRSKLNLIIGNALEGNIQAVLDAGADAMEAALKEHHIRKSDRAETYEFDGRENYDWTAGMERMQGKTSKIVSELRHLAIEARRLMEAPNPGITEGAATSGPVASSKQPQDD